jgi:hypothetical protein
MPTIEDFTSLQRAFIDLRAAARPVELAYRWGVQPEPKEIEAFKAAMKRAMNRPVFTFSAPPKETILGSTS